MEKITPKLINWASILEDKTRAQAQTTATMPFVFPHVALMPDAHLGLGAKTDLVEVRHTLRQIVNVKGD